MSTAQPAEQSNGYVAQQCPQCGAPLSADGERVVCAYCGSALLRMRAPAGQGAAIDQDQPPAWGVHLKTYVCVDREGIGSEAFRMLVPATWTFEGGVRWLMNNPGMPACIAFRVYNPQGVEQFEAFPNIPCYWTNNPMVTGMLPPGGLYYGNEVRPPLPALQALEEMVLPRHRGHVRGLHVAERERLPDLAEQMQASSPVAPTGVTEADGGRLRLHYREGASEIEEDLFGVVEISRNAMPMMGFMGAMEQIFWMADYLFSFRAAAGALDRMADTYTAIVRSFRLDPAWYSRYVQVSQFMIQNQIQQIQHVGQISQIISQTNDEISDMIMAGYEGRQQTLDRMAARFSQAVRGVDEYADAAGDRSVELPGGYRNAWGNALGEYILTDDPTYDPNADATLEGSVDWQSLRRR